MKKIQTAFRCLILFFLLWLIAGVTAPKIQRAAQLLGWLPGGGPEEVVVTQKWRQPGPEGAFWISWTGRSIREAGNHRLNVSRDRWEATPVGARIGIVRVPDSAWPRWREDMRIPWRNVALDLALLAIETVAAMAIVLTLFRIRRPWRHVGRGSPVLKISPEGVFRSRVSHEERLTFTQEEA